MMDQQREILNRDALYSGHDMLLEIEKLQEALSHAEKRIEELWEKERDASGL